MLNNKKNMMFTITEDNAEEFAVIPTRDLENIMRSVQGVASHAHALQELMRAAGFDTFAMKNSVKTLADIPAFSRPE